MSAPAPSQPSSARPSPQVVVQLLGGLGNQMFQAAAGFALARRLDVQLVFDLSRFRKGGMRAFALQPFGLGVPCRLAPSGLRFEAKRLAARLLGSKDKHRPGWFQGTLYREPHFHFDPAFEALKADVLLSGYFQSPRYFSGYEEEIAAAFAPEKIASDYALLEASRIEPSSCAAIHLRQGDYTTKAAGRVHGVLDSGYYDRAVALLRARHPDIRFLVFSDNSAMARAAAARWPGAEAIIGLSAGDDFFLMSHTRHRIIANSSFSWWAAWLGEKPESTTITPQNWFMPGAGATRATHDLIPAHWERL